MFQNFPPNPRCQSAGKSSLFIYNYLLSSLINCRTYLFYWEGNIQNISEHNFNLKEQWKTANENVNKIKKIYVRTSGLNIDSGTINYRLLHTLLFDLKRLLNLKLVDQ